MHRRRRRALKSCGKECNRVVRRAATSLAGKSSASFRGCPGGGSAAYVGVAPAQGPLIASGNFDLGKDQSGFVLESLMHLLVILLGEFPGAVLELEIAQII